jgi:outer membrane protein OmpA-like peptidoglycan-associated protein
MPPRLPFATIRKAFITAAALLLLGRSAQASDLETSDRRPLPARLGDFSLLVEPGVALALASPQSDLFKTGGGQTVKALWVVNEYMNVGPSATFITLPTEASHGEAGAAWTYGATVRFRLFRNTPERFLGMSPWVDFDALYVRTGGLQRPGFAAAAGWSIPLGKARVFWLGPFARYLHVMQEGRPGFDGRDGKFLTVGLGLEVSLGAERERAVVAAEIRTVNRETIVCPDRDNDGTPDSVDRCPDVAGTMDNWGCPAYQKLVVQRDKLELKEKLFFAWDQSVLQEVSFPALDEVVHALNDNRGFRVQVEGHASSEGTDEHNQILSEQRADAVLNYLVLHGIDRDRLASKGLGSSVPRDTNETLTGRENNRRVEFVVYFLILDNGSR